MKYGMLLTVLVLAMLMPVELQADGSFSTSHMPQYSFDTDNDGIDDSIEGKGPFFVVIHVSDQGDLREISDLVSGSGSRIENLYTRLNFITAVLKDREVLEELSDHRDVEVIEQQIFPDLLMDTSVPSVKASPSMRYSPETSHDIGFQGSGQTIAVIDTGVDNEHPMLQGSLVAGLDMTLPSSPLTPWDGTFDPDDRSGHGTAVASIALGREYEGYVGVAPEAGLIDIKIVTSLNQDINPFTDELLGALEWVYNNMDTEWGDGYSGVDVITISLGIGPGDGAVSESITDLVSSGVVIVQAAGNSNGPYSEQTSTSWPDGSIIIGGVDNSDTVERSDDEAWSVSTSGPRTDDDDEDRFDELKPDVTAPAVNIEVASYSQTSNLQPADGWALGTGTSYAAPHAAGTVALMLEANPSVRPDSSGNPVARILHQTAEPRGSPYDPSLSEKYDVNYGFGILDAYRAVLSARSYTSTNRRPQITSFSARPAETTTGSAVTLTVVAEDDDEDPLAFELEVDSGSYTGNGPVWEWTAPDEPGEYSFLVTVTDTDGASDQRRTSVTVVEGDPNRAPVITSFFIEDETLTVGASSQLTTIATDPDGDPLDYEYDTIRGTIQGSGDIVTYVAPDSPGTDTLYVRVIDDKGAYSQRELLITILERQTNSPPNIVLLTLDPPRINGSNMNDRLVLTALVEDPDGSNDIALVVADLTSVGGASGERMWDDGTNGDNISSDGIYTIIITLPPSPEDGSYRISVTAYDTGDAQANASIELNIAIPPSGSVASGPSQGRDMTLIVILLIIIFVIVVVISGALMLRGRKKRRTMVTYAMHPNIGKVRYRPSGPSAPPIQAMPSGQQPKFNVIQGP